MNKESVLIGAVVMLTIRRRHGSPGGIPVMMNVTIRKKEG